MKKKHCIIAIWFIIILIFIFLINFNFKYPEVSRSLDSIYKISVYSTNSNIPDLGGTGFAIDEHTIITNYHVVNSPQKIVAYDSEGNSFDVNLYKYDIKSDIALLRTTSKLVPIKLDSNLPKNNVAVFMIKDGGLKKGVMVAQKQSLPGIEMVCKFIKINGIPTEKGDSGSPILNDDGNAIGLVVARTIDNNITSTYATPIADIQKILDCFKDNDSYPHIQLGISVMELNKYHQNYPGVIIDKVLPKGLAYGKLKEGDIIKRFNGVSVCTYQDIGYELFTKGEKLNNLKIELIRNNETYEVDIHMGNKIS